MNTLQNLKKDLRKFERPTKAKILTRFFKTGKGEYAEGDSFLGLKTDETKFVSKKYKDLNYKDLKTLLLSKIHEERMTAIMIMVERFKKGDFKTKEEVYDFYCKNLLGINNWDLVDVSCPHIIGGYLFISKKSRKTLYDLARSDNLWLKRISIMSSFYFIRENDFEDSLKISKILLRDKHDLIHKAVGWMLREIGKRDMDVEEKFLRAHYKKMPRTTLRYAIEKFPESLRIKYLHSKI